MTLKENKSHWVRWLASPWDWEQDLKFTKFKNPSPTWNVYLNRLTNHKICHIKGVLPILSQNLWLVEREKEICTYGLAPWVWQEGIDFAKFNPFLKSVKFHLSPGQDRKKGKKEMPAE